MRYVYTFLAELCCASIYKHETDNEYYNKLGCNITTYSVVNHRNSEAGLISCYNKDGCNSYYDEAGCIGILLRILQSDQWYCVIGYYLFSSTLYLVTI